ncbi:MAG: bifunctional (p)ppGpp synthetase/guanosine-3',5'-bis(diphosphate) 3'-pyrophosphohydrolase [Betaproteobacteria bacterium]|nr:bifunctional (p)ppGpp synthetase/guanosine-3',5'-bis(diphosphate) 3'-pyrophosphohydrolase [Betaproteobacteria bacterium]
MVAVAHAAPQTSGPEAIAAWLAGLAGIYPPDDVAGIAAALEYARTRVGNTTGRDGEPLQERALGTATILAGLKLDAGAVRAALLLGLPGAGAFDVEAVTDAFGADVAALVAGVARMDDIRALPATGSADDRSAQAERLRKMLLAMVEDIRVVLIKLAERTQALRFLMTCGDGAQALRERTAHEVLELFAPLANRLGVWQLKWELEDLSLRALEPETYKTIARMLDERRLDRSRYIDEVVATLKRELAAAGIRAEVTGRPKHIYSIWNKMRRKQSGIDTLYDIRAVRILVDDVKDCYAALGIVHHLWTPLPREFDDYIAKPKANDYRSLHTAVIGPEDKPLEVQIRTFEMHQHSEYGVAAHWRYKEGAHKGVRRDPAFEDRIAWLRQVLDWKDAVADASEWMSAFKSSLFTDTIYVLTPQGRVVDLPRGATPIDFAYAVHTNLGHRCRGARVDGALVPLNHVLKNGQQVEIVTAKQGGPSRDWLNPELGYVHSHRARTKVRQWFKAQQLDATLAQGRAIVERELQRAGATAVNLDAVAGKAGLARADELFAGVARDEINLRQLQAAIRAVTTPGAGGEAPAEPEVIARASRAEGAGSGIMILGVDRLMTHLARCCKPAPPDGIVGFVTRGKGVTIHRRNCASVARLHEREPERLIAAEWGAARDEVFPVDVVLEAMDRQGLLRDVTEVFSREKVNVTAAHTQSRNLHVRMGFTLEVRSLDALQRALALVRDVPGVVSAGRR